ncbi:MULTISPECIES: hypothetical protein [Mycolicibacterium]|uniref:hypothetical protein n=1 Tax=Mycolicibacterium TaxID=1866885 RepID=UPI001191D803|nr:MULTISPECIES: hypothetical protein [Mycolicibacterium]MBX8687046.1 hypothetical protein [Mycobacterium sp. 20091114027_K0903767]MCA4724831.1 hypothetical protein [Mycolicibacterium fortuitum]TVY05941.1 hypothetical protein FPV58_01335 [Mycolicibacterium porcinum]
MYKRWVSIYEFRWTPILTYTRRNLKLLDWFERNTEPVAFFDEPAKLGVAIGAGDLRLTVQRSGMTIESGLSGLPVSDLLPAIQGVFEVMEPKETVLTFANIVSTFELASDNYDEARRIFAQAVAGVPPQLAGLQSVDASVLADLESPEASTQIEWGIVQNSELLYRLRNPRLGRIKRPGQVESLRSGGNIMPTGLPDVGVYVESVAEVLQGGDVADAPSVGNVIVKAEDAAQQVTLGLSEKFNTVEASTKEGSAW